MTSIALIVDIVGSRQLTSRAKAQEAIRSAFERAEEHFPAELPLWATVGDEFQARFTRLGAALAITALVRLTLPGDVDCRFGIGEGDAIEVEVNNDGSSIQDGSAWWHAREAISTGRRLQTSGHPYLRTWFASDDPSLTAAVNALLLQRDQAISRMKSRERRLAAGLLEGNTQTQLATVERISQSAVSQTLSRSGAIALVSGLKQFSGGGSR
ncbi:SatD family protein [Rathayibacter sp. YIM 133350]|uniref:SatD family protein n=1 Tax=Rathayibacter sp. YIM 133350 TaxID=3131992 RepID=UPI00307F2076